MRSSESSSPRSSIYLVSFSEQERLINLVFDSFPQRGHRVNSLFPGLLPRVELASVRDADAVCHFAFSQSISLLTVLLAAKQIILHQTFIASRSTCFAHKPRAIIKQPLQKKCHSLSFNCDIYVNIYFKPFSPFISNVNHGIVIMIFITKYNTGGIHDGCDYCYRPFHYYEYRRHLAVHLGYQQGLFTKMGRCSRSRGFNIIPCLSACLFAKRERSVRLPKVDRYNCG